MEIISLVTTIILIHIFAWLTPGPLFFIIIRNSLIYSRKIWYFTALGFSLWNFAHIILAISWISLVIQSSSIALYWVKLLWIWYLLYLWVKTILITSSKNWELSNEKDKKFSRVEAIKMWFLASMSSIGAYLFFASIFSTVMTSDGSYVSAYILAIAMPINTFIMASILNIFFTHAFIKKHYEKYAFIVNRWLGISLILLAWISMLDLIQ
jgi:threonine/homoserine/homoserine lactone efflux protein